MRGKLIAIEGIDCSGKTTLVSLIAQELRHRGYDPIILEEFGTLVGQFFFKSVVEEDLGISIPAQVLIRAAGQISELMRNVSETKDPTTILLADRYIDSNVVYQTVGYMLQPSEITVDNSSFKEWAAGIYGSFYIEPIVTFVLDLPVNVALERARQNNEPIKSAKFLELARQGFLDCVDKNPQKYKIIDAAKPQINVLSTVMECLDKILQI